MKYLNKFIILITLLFSSNVFATESSWYSAHDIGKRPLPEQCIRDAKEFSNRFKVDKNCFFSFNKIANDKQKEASLDKTVYTLGYKNILFTVVKSKENNKFIVKRSLLAGSKTTFVDIKSVALSKNKKLVAVLDNQRIKIFQTGRHGNIGPTKVLSHDDIAQASRIKFHPNDNEIVVISEEISTVQIFPIHFDSRHPKQKNFVRSNSIVGSKDDLFNKPTDVIIDEKTNEIFILDQANSEIYVYSLVKNSKVKRSIATIGISNPTSFTYDKVNKEFNLKNNNTKARVKK